MIYVPQQLQISELIVSLEWKLGQKELPRDFTDELIASWWGVQMAVGTMEGWPLFWRGALQTVTLNNNMTQHANIAVNPCVENAMETRGPMMTGSQLYTTTY